MKIGNQRINLVERLNEKINNLEDIKEPSYSMRILEELNYLTALKKMKSDISTTEQLIGEVFEQTVSTLNGQSLEFIKVHINQYALLTNIEFNKINTDLLFRQTAVIQKDVLELIICSKEIIQSIIDEEYINQDIDIYLDFLAGYFVEALTLVRALVYVSVPKDISEHIAEGILEHIKVFAGLVQLRCRSSLPGGN